MTGRLLTQVSGLAVRNACVFRHPAVTMRNPQLIHQTPTFGMDVIPAVIPHVAVRM